MLSLQASLSVPLITFYLSLVNFVNLNSALDSNAGLCTPYPCNQPPQPPSSTGYSPYGNPPPPSSPSSPPPPPSSPRSHCPPVPGCCNQPPPSTYNQPPPSSYSPPYPYFFTPPYPYGTLGGGEGGGGGQGGGGGAGGGTTGAAVTYDSSSVPVYVLMLVLSYVFVVF